MSAKILVVDDEVPVATVIKANLEIEGYEVETAYDGNEGLQKARQFKPDLILLDVMMPEKDGWTVLQEIRQDPELKETPVVMLTALSQATDIARGWESGVDCYLTKPFDPLEMIEICKRILQAQEFDEETDAE